MNSIKENIEQIRKTIPHGVTLVCVSKFHPVSAILDAYKAGEREFGESRVQELLLKQQQITEPDIKWHFIGHLQTNKVKQVVGNVAQIDSVDSLHLMQLINKAATEKNLVQDILLELHVAEETTKTGILPQDLSLFMEEAKNLPHIRVKGLMGMASNTDDVVRIKSDFRQLKMLFENFFDKNSNCQLSMGMSDDYLLAVEEGSTEVRIGSGIFGERK